MIFMIFLVINFLTFSMLAMDQAPYNSPIFMADLEIQAKRAARKVLDDVVWIQDVEREALHYGQYLQEEYGNYPDDVVHHLVNKFRDAITTSKISQWMQQVHDELPTYINPHDEEKLQLQVRTFKKVSPIFRHSSDSRAEVLPIPDYPAYKLLIDAFERNLRARIPSKYWQNLQEAELKSVKEKQDFLKAQKIDRIKKDVSEIIELQLALKDDQPLQLGKKAMLRDILNDIGKEEVSPEELQNIMQYAQHVLEHAVHKKFKKLNLDLELLPDSPRNSPQNSPRNSPSAKSPRSVAWAKRKQVFTYEADADSFQQTPKTSHYTPLTRPLPVPRNLD
jgi:hypothetical protein